MSEDGSPSSDLSIELTNLLKYSLNQQPQTPKLSDNLQINLKLNSQNYALWTRMIRVAIGGKSKSLLNHLTANPQDTKHETSDQWEQDDLVVFSWLIQNIESTLAGNLTEFPTAKSLWDALVVTYSSGKDKLFTGGGDRNFGVGGIAAADFKGDNENDNFEVTCIGEERGFSKSPTFLSNFSYFIKNDFNKCEKREKLKRGYANVTLSNDKRRNKSSIFDCGATDTMTYDISDLTSLSKPSKMYIHTANEEKMEVKMGGMIEFSGNLKLNNCLYVPALSHKLLSISYVTKELNCSLLMHPTFCILQDIQTGRIIGRGTERHGLYFVDEVTQNGVVMLAHGSTEREAWLWHRRLGHPST